MSSRTGWTELAVQSYVLEESPIAAGADLDVADTLAGDHHIRRIPEREQRQITADLVPRLLVKLLRLLTVGCANCLDK